MLSLNNGVDVQPIAKDRYLAEMMLAGDIDAFMTARAPSLWPERKPNIDRLWPDYMEVERDYCRRIGIFPIMRFVGVRRDVVERHDWLPASLLEAFHTVERIARAEIPEVSCHMRPAGNPQRGKSRVERPGRRCGPRNGRGSIIGGRPIGRGEGKSMSTRLEDDDAEVLDRRWPRYEAAALGFRHYWYPALESRKLKKRPRPVMLLGEKIVLVRGNGRVHALADRCPHRGVPLSAGACAFPGMITCAYHGWTFDLEGGDLVAALTDGPDSPIRGSPAARVPTYPAEERAGLIWVYVGDGPPPPVEADVPAELLAPDAVVEPMVELRKGNWRYAMENAVDEAHAKYLHRKTPFYLFSQFPGYQTDTRMAPSEDGLWLRRTSTPVFEPAEYPGIGKWPKHDPWRKPPGKPRKEGGVGVVIAGGARLPAIFSVGHEDWIDFQMFVPVDVDRHLTLQVSMRRTRGLGTLIWRLRYWTYIRYIHHVMLNRWEDGHIVSVTDSPPERLFRPDISVVAWRRWCEENARRSPADAA